VFTFYDSSGNQISPGPIPWDGTTEFEGYFSQYQSQLGGVFSLNGIFPINGNNPDDVASAVVQLTNSQGTTQTAKIEF